MTGSLLPQIDINQTRSKFIQAVFTQLNATNRFYLCGDSLIYIDRQDQTFKTLGKADLEIALSMEIDWVKHARQMDGSVSIFVSSAGLRLSLLAR